MTAKFLKNTSFKKSKLKQIPRNCKIILPDQMLPDPRESHFGANTCHILIHPIVFKSTVIGKIEILSYVNVLDHNKVHAC